MLTEAQIKIAEKYRKPIASGLTPEQMQIAAKYNPATVRQSRPAVIPTAYGLGAAAIGNIPKPEPIINQSAAEALSMFKPKVSKEYGLGAAAAGNLPKPATAPSSLYSQITQKPTAQKQIQGILSGNLSGSKYKQSEVDNAAEIFNNYELVYQNMSGKELSDMDKSRVKKILENLQTIRKDSESGSLVNDLAIDYFTRFQKMEDSKANYVGYTMGKVGAGIASAPLNVGALLTTVVGDIATGGKVSDSYKKLSEYFSTDKETYDLLMGPTGLQSYYLNKVSKATGVPQNILRSYRDAKSSEYFNQSVEKTMGEGISPKYKDTAGNWAYVIGQQIPGILMSAGGTGGGGIIGSALSGNGILGPLKAALKGNMATWLIGASAAQSKLMANAEKSGASVNNYLNAIGTGTIEAFTEGLFGFSDMASYKAVFASPTGKSASTIFKGIVNYIASGFEEGLEEVVNVPLEGLLDKYTVNKGMKWTGDGGVFDIQAMISQGVDGAIVGLIMGGIGAAASIKSALQESGDIRTAVKEINNLANKTLPGELAPLDINSARADVDKRIAEYLSALESKIQSIAPAETPTPTPPQTVPTTTPQAAPVLQPVTNSEAERILADPEALSKLGVVITPGMTKSQQRAAVKAAQAPQSPTAPSQPVQGVSAPVGVDAPTASEAVEVKPVEPEAARTGVKANNVYFTRNARMVQTKTPIRQTERNANGIIYVFSEKPLSASEISKWELTPIYQQPIGSKVNTERRNDGAPTAQPTVQPQPTAQPIAQPTAQVTPTLQLPQVTPTTQISNNEAERVLANPEAMEKLGMVTTPGMPKSQQRAAVKAAVQLAQAVSTVEGVDTTTRESAVESQAAAQEPTSVDTKLKLPTVEAKPKQSSKITEDVQREINKEIASQAFEKAMKKMGYATIQDKMEADHLAPKSNINANGLRFDLYANRELQFEALVEQYKSQLSKSRELKNSVAEKYYEKQARNQRNKEIEDSFALEDWEVPQDILLERSNRLYRKEQDIAEHRAAISKALSDGKSVPQKVLADYPDLQQDSGTAEPASVGAATAEQRKPVLKLPTVEKRKAQTATRDSELRLPSTENKQSPQKATPETVELPSVGAATMPKYKTKTSEFYTNTLKNTEVISDEAKAELHPDDFAYISVSEKESLERAQQNLEVDFDGSVNELSNKETFTDAEDVDTAMGILAAYGAEAAESGDYSKVIQWAKETLRKTHSSATSLQALSKYSRTPQGVLIRAAKTLSEIDGLSQDKINEILGNMAQFVETLEAIQDENTGDLVDLIVRQANVRNTKVSKRILNGLKAETSFKYLYEFALQQLESIALDYVPTSTGKKISTYQAMSHLVNIRTALRNVVSNQLFDIIDTLANNVSLLPDAIISMFTKKRTVGLQKSWLSQAKREGAREGSRRSSIEVSLDVSMNKATKYGTSRRTWKANNSKLAGRVMSNIEKLIGYELNVTDEFHKGSVFAEVIDSLESLVDKGHITMEEATEWATHEALYRSFQDNTLPGAILAGVKDVLNLVGVGDSGRTIKGAKVRDFGLGDLIQKYTQVPGALISRAIEFSPVGYAKAIIALAQNKSSAQRTAALAIGRATTGTGFIAAFAALAASGLLRRSEDEEDKDIGALNASEGIGGTQLNVSGVSRWMSGGSTEWQSGDTVMSIDFLEPLNALMTVGSLIAQDTSEKSFLLKMTDHTLEGVFLAIKDTPTMQTLDNIYQTIQYHDPDTDLPLWAEIPVTIGESAITGFVPSLIRQFAQATDDTYRDLYSSQNALTQVGDKIFNTIPGLRQTLPEKITNLGENKEYTNPWLNAFNATIFPGTVNVYTQSDVSKELQKIRSETGLGNIYPDRNAPYTIRMNNETFTLTGDERRDFQRIRGTFTYSLMQDIMQNGDYKNASKSQKAAMLADAVSFGNDMAKRDFFESRGKPFTTNTWNKTIEAMQAGISFATYRAYAEAVSGMSATPDPNNPGKTIHGSLKEKIISYIDKQKLKPAQKDALYILAGYAETTIDEAPWN